MLHVGGVKFKSLYWLAADYDPLVVHVLHVHVHVNVNVVPLQVFVSIHVTVIEF